MAEIENLGPVAEGSLLLWRCKHLGEEHAESVHEMADQLGRLVPHKRWALMCLTGDDDLTMVDPELLAAALRVAGWTVTAP